MMASAGCGLHILADLHGVAPDKLVHAQMLDELLRRSAHAAGATVLNSHFHGFGPGLGITGVVLLAESHISAHTWPELGYAALDIFMCGSANPEKALQMILFTLAPLSCTVRRIRREPAIAENEGNEVKQADRPDSVTADGLAPGRYDSHSSRP